MTMYFRAFISAVIGLLAAASTASALPAAKPGVAAHSNLIKVGDRYDHRYDRHYHHRYRHGRNVVHAPFTRVESGRRTVVDAPFVHVYNGRHGTHVVAPFVNYWD